MITHHIRRLLALICAMAVLTTACGEDAFDASSASDSATSETVDAAMEDSGDARSDEATAAVETSDTDAANLSGVAQSGTPSADGLGAGGATGSQVSAQDLGREIIFTATISVEVDDVATASADASRIVESVGGFVFGQDTIGGSEPRSTLTFKVRPDRFNEALEQLGSIGELRNQTITTDDVTERVVDLSSRIEVAELGVERLRAAMENATDLEDFAELEGLLLARESDLEVMRGQLRTIRDRVDLATITLTVSQARIDNAVRLDVTVYAGHDGGQACPGGAQNVNVEVDTPATLCLEVTNVGDQTLRDLAITDTVLDIDGPSDLIAVFGSLDELAPGQSAMAAVEISPDRASQPRLRVSGTPTDGTSAEPTGTAVSGTDDLTIRVFEAERDPGFSDGWDAARNLLASLWVVLTVLVGFLLPLLVLVPVLWAVWRLLRRARRNRRVARSEEASSRREPVPATGGPAQTDE